MHWTATLDIALTFVVPPALCSAPGRHNWYPARFANPDPRLAHVYEWPHTSLEAKRDGHDWPISDRPIILRVIQILTGSGCLDSECSEVQKYLNHALLEQLQRPDALDLRNPNVLRGVQVE